MDLESLELHKDPDLVQMLVNLTRSAKELSKPKRTNVNFTESGVQFELIQPPLYETNRKDKKRQKIDEGN